MRYYYGIQSDFEWKFKTLDVALLWIRKIGLL